VGSRSFWPSGSSAPPVPDLPTVPGPARLALARLAAVELGAQLVTAALPAFGDLLDGAAQRLEPVQLPRSRALGGPGGAGAFGPEALNLLVEVAGQPP
jgi:hypothetical protein